MNLQNSPFSVLDKNRKEMEYIKGVYKKRVQSEIDSYKDQDEDCEFQEIKSQDILMVDSISI